MSINNFSSLFEILIGLNLGYAGSKTFREAVDNKILRLPKIQTDKMASRKEDIMREARLLSLEEPIKNRVEEIDKNFNRNITALNAQEEEARKFPNGLKSMFLMSFIIGMSVLFVGGYDDWTESGCNASTMIIVLNFAIFYNLFVFFRSFSVRHMCRNIKPTITLIIASTIVIFSYTYFSYCTWPNRFGAVKDNIVNTSGYPAINISLLICLSPYILHFIRLRIHKMVYRTRYNNKFLVAEKNLETLQRNLAHLNTTINWERDSSNFGLLKIYLANLLKRIRKII